MRVLDLFAGIGGFSLAAEWMGWQTVAFCEQNEYCQRVLRKNFGDDICIYDDITTLSTTPFRGSVDLITGGFPCQDISVAGKQAGIRGKRSGLWSEMYRIIGDIRPKYVVVENVAALLGRGMDVVLGDLSESGYDAEWRTFSACEMGFPHSRERVFIVAYPNGKPRSFSVLDRYCETVTGRDTGSEKWGEDWFVPEMVSTPTSLLRLWETKFSQSPLVRMDDGISDVLDKLRVTGNAIIPQIAFEIFKAIQYVEDNQ